MKVLLIFFQSLNILLGYLQQFYNFYKYFVDTYVANGKYKLWSMAFRQNVSTHTNNHLEAYHRQLKYKYLKNSLNIRLDTVIYTLVDMDLNLNMDNVVASIKGTVKPSKNKYLNILKGHFKSKKIKNIIKTSDDTYHVESESIKNCFYIVKTINKECNLSCFYCTHCGVCSHMFSCTCDFHGKICKHVHAVKSCLKKSIIFLNLYLYKYENVCLSLYSRFSRLFGIQLGYPLAQMCILTSKWF